LRTQAREARDMPTPKKIDLHEEEIRISTRMGLEATYDTDQDFFCKLLPNLESKILEIITTEIIANIQLLCNGASHEAGPAFRSKEGALFKISVNKNLRSPEDLDIAFLPMLVINPSTIEKSVSLKECRGGYKTVNIVATKAASIKSKELGKLVESVIGAAYEWIYFKISKIGRETNESITEKIYGRLQGVYFDKDIFNDLWLGFVYKEKCYYLIDANRRARLLNIMEEKGRKLGVEPVELACKIIEMNLTFSQSAAKNAFSEGKHLMIDIGRLPYSESSPNLLVAEQILYNTNQIAVIPVIHLESPETFLVGFCPAKDCGFWVNALDFNKHDLEAIISQEIKSLSLIARASNRFFPKNSFPLSPKFIGDTSANFLATFIQRIPDLLKPF
jgi:hypothetical protein